MFQGRATKNMQQQVFLVCSCFFQVAAGSVNPPVPAWLLAQAEDSFAWIAEGRLHDMGPNCGVWEMSLDSEFQDCVSDLL